MFTAGIALAFLLCFGCCFACTALAFFSRAGLHPVAAYADVYRELDAGVAEGMGMLDGRLVAVSDCRAGFSNSARRQAMGLYHDNILPAACFLETNEVAYYLAPASLRPWRESHSNQIMNHFNALCSIGMGLSYLHRNHVYHGHLTIDAVLLGTSGACLADWCQGTLGEHPWREWPLGGEVQRPTENGDLWDLGWTVWQMFSDGQSPCASWDARPKFMRRLRKKPGEVFRGMNELMPPDLANLCIQQWSETQGARPVAGAFVVQVERMAGFSSRTEIDFN